MQKKKKEWSRIVKQVLVFKSDIRRFVPICPVDIVIWDLLGDYGQTELVPDTLASVYKYLKSKQHRGTVNNIVQSLLCP
ncbi:MAG: hypothetical protein GY696_10155 [Gammaproteobacteria bacterium]|nr:hypothetical protein [Gammaproteobacteria bacterium]